MKINKINSFLICIGLIVVGPFTYECKKAAAADGGVTGTQKAVFVHPGIINTKESLDLIGSEVTRGDAARTASFQKVIDFIDKSTYPTSFPDTIVVGSNGATSPSKSQIRKDSELVYAFALRWAQTGKQEYADKTIGLLNGWAYNFKSYALLNAATNKLQPALEASWTTPGFVAAAEIIRYYKVNGKSAGWSEKDIKQFSAYLNNVKTNYIDRTPIYNNNWNASAGYAKMAIGVFLNDAGIYQTGVDDIKKYIPVIINPDGSIPEYCHRKDCVHFQYSLTAFAYSAAIAKIQGDNSIWSADSNRIHAGYEFMKKAYDGSGGCNFCTISSPVFPGIEVAYNQNKTENLSYLRALNAPLSVPGDHTFIGFTTYTHFNVPVL